MESKIDERWSVSEINEVTVKETLKIRTVKNMVKKVIFVQF